MPSSRVKLYKSRAWLYRKLITEKLSETEVAELANTTQQTINKQRKEFGF